MKKLTVYVCEGTGCVSSSSPEIRKKLEEETKRLGLESSVEVKFGGCQGFCEMGPLVGVDPEGILYTRVKVEDAPEIVREHFQNGKPVERLFYVDPITNKPIPRYNDIQFYKKQMRWLLSNSGHINPENIDDYINVSGYRALKKALEMTP